MGEAVIRASSSGVRRARRGTDRRMGRPYRIAVVVGVGLAGGLAAARPGVCAPSAAPGPALGPALGPPAPDGSSHSAFSIQSWRTDDGLPSDMVSDVTQDKDGYLWVATNAGVARFDGVRFQSYDLQN